MLNDKIYSGDNEFLKGNPAMEMWDYIDRDLNRKKFQSFLREAEEYWRAVSIDEADSGDEFQNAIKRLATSEPGTKEHSQATAYLIAHPKVKSHLKRTGWTVHKARQSKGLTITSPGDMTDELTQDVVASGQLHKLAKEFHSGKHAGKGAGQYAAFLAANVARDRTNRQEAEKKDGGQRTFSSMSGGDDGEEGSAADDLEKKDKDDEGPGSLGNVATRTDKRGNRAAASLRKHPAVKELGADQKSTVEPLSDRVKSSLPEPKSKKPRGRKSIKDLPLWDRGGQKAGEHVIVNRMYEKLRKSGKHGDHDSIVDEIHRRLSKDHPDDATYASFSRRTIDDMVGGREDAQKLRTVTPKSRGSGGTRGTGLKTGGPLGDAMKAERKSAGSKGADIQHRMRVAADKFGSEKQKKLAHKYLDRYFAGEHGQDGDFAAEHGVKPGYFSQIKRKLHGSGKQDPVMRELAGKDDDEAAFGLKGKKAAYKEKARAAMAAKKRKQERRALAQRTRFPKTSGKPGSLKTRLAGAVTDPPDEQADKFAKKAETDKEERRKSIIKRRRDVETELERSLGKKKAWQRRQEFHGQHIALPRGARSRPLADPKETSKEWDARLRSRTPLQRRRGWRDPFDKTQAEKGREEKRRGEREAPLKRASATMKEKGVSPSRRRALTRALATGAIARATDTRDSAKSKAPTYGRRGASSETGGQDKAWAKDVKSLSGLSRQRKKGVSPSKERALKSVASKQSEKDQPKWGPKRTQDERQVPWKKYGKGRPAKKDSFADPMYGKKERALKSVASKQSNLTPAKSRALRSVAASQPGEGRPKWALRKQGPQDTPWKKYGSKEPVATESLFDRVLGNNLQENSRRKSASLFDRVVF